MKIRNFLIISFFFLLFIFIFPCFVKGYIFTFDALEGKSITCDFGDIDLRKNTFIAFTNVGYDTWGVSLISFNCDFHVVLFQGYYYLCLNSGEEYLFCYTSFSSDSDNTSKPSSSTIKTVGDDEKILRIMNTDNFKGRWFGYSNFDIKNDKGEIIFGKTSFVNPFFVNKDNIQTGKFDKVVINGGDYNLTSDEIYLLTYYYSENTDNPMESLYPRKEILLKYHGDYWVGANNEQFIYEVPLSKTGIDLVER